MRRHEHDGFTLVELVVAVTILGIIMGAITSSMITVVRTFGATADRLSQSHDAQLLSTWLVPDLQSASAPTGVTFSPAVLPAGVTCPSGAPFSQLRLQWTDAEDSTGYVATYQVTASFELERTLAVTPLAGATTSESRVVVHNLEDPAQPPPGGASPLYPTCIDQTADGKVTLTITTLIENGSAQFTFAVTAQTRQPYAPPPPLPPSEPVSGDSNNDGRADTVTVHFDQAILCTNGTDSCETSQWTVTNQPGQLASGVPPQSVDVNSDNKSVTLTLQPSIVDTKATGMAVEGAPGSVAGVSGAAVFAARAVLDGMAPVMEAASAQDVNLSGTLDQVTVRFSEALTLVPGIGDYTLIGGPDGGTRQPTAVTQSATDPREHLLTFPTVAVDTRALGASLEVNPGTASDGERVNLPGLQLIRDEMKPVLDPAVAPVTADVDTDGRADRVTFTFSENLSGASGSQWSLSQAPSGATPSTATVAGKVVTLVLNEGGGPLDTATSSFTIGLNEDANGVRDQAGNLSSFSPIATVDAMKPLLTSVLTTSAITAGLVEAGDTLSLGFTEPMAAGSVPVAPTLKADRAGNATNFSLPGLAQINMGVRYTDTTFSCATTTSLPVVSSGTVVLVTVGSCGAGAVAATASNGTVSTSPPNGAVTDLASPTANTVVGPVSLVNTVLF